MAKLSKNPCIRCGKERRVVKTWVERTQTSLITYSLSICPDPACQKIVDKQNQEHETKRLMRLASSKRSHQPRSKQLVLKRT